LSPLATVDYWQVLGLEPGADPASLKRAFRQQARRWHPDLNGNDPVAEERFKQVNEAYAVLSDPRRRRAWEAGEEPVDQAVDTDPFASGFPPFEDYLERLFGEVPRPRRSAPERGDIHRGGPRGTPWSVNRLAIVPGDVTASPPPPPPVPAASDRGDHRAAHARARRWPAPAWNSRCGTAPWWRCGPRRMAGDGWRLRLAGVTPGGGDHFLQLRVRTAEGLRVDGLRVHYLLEISPAEAALGLPAG
jgi:DnaJ-class molecular chaperone with C-terminal Zn finger domain